MPQLFVYYVNRNLMNTCRNESSLSIAHPNNEACTTPTKQGAYTKNVTLTLHTTRHMNKSLSHQAYKVNT